MNQDLFLQEIKGQLIVSCQALPGEPLYGADHMAKMALAAKQGGAAAIRANSVTDILAIKAEVDLPVIGLIKQNYKDSPVFITPTKKEVQLLIEAEVDVIAIEATFQERPNQERFEELIDLVRNSCNSLIMADVSTYEEGFKAIELGVDLISTTLSSYTSYTKEREIPDLPLIERLSQQSPIPIIAEGNIKTPEEAAKAIHAGAYAVVVGAAITRPQIITKSFYEAVQEASVGLNVKRS
ncbi:N-acetylmannosamine-6-phosphate 2-epimerase [Alkalihalobacillus pseudalcaliphilus]|uniref:N-acetylmannosamine-6-phosphate 2-epimerase n=1 Tax=Alkalihalobacillus pseudalcaliphilus TaxID=79884 RepID=UPI00064D8171|nr:N-acetylmannosamine-6-phosphate 2-epimerase [Alkalihalobacillus pseudalcaliphilus]KMK78068.1 N-acetylmannosamine-6-phosphate 2-epimerase [Alkalihalobacillus pseudalcaliphilus]